MTTQSHRLTSLCVILKSLQSPQRNAIEDDHENRDKQVHSGTQSSKVKRGMKEDMVTDFQINPKKHAQCCDMYTSFSKIVHH